MATRSAGRVTIRVLPDSSRFREDLRLSLERIEKSMKVTIPAHLAVTRESVRELRRQLSELDVRIKVEPYITQERLHDVKKQIEDIDANLQVGLNTALARGRLAVLTRPRVVELIVRVNQASLVAAATTLAALSGARMLGNTFDKFWDAIKDLDKNAPRIGAIFTGINTLAGGVLALTSNLAGLLGSFVQLSGLAVILPALLTGAGIAIGTLFAVLKDGKTVLADLGPLFTELQDSMSAEFWNVAADPIREVVRNLMPALREQLINTSQALGVVTKSLSQALGDNLTAERLNTMFDNLNQAISRASGAMNPLVSAFTTLGLVGSRYLPRLSSWFVKLSEDFNRFITEAAADGRLDLWAERGIQAFKDLGRVIKEAGRVLGALIQAANNAGGAGFGQLADGLGRLADVMNTANFQTTLSTIFRGAHALMDGLISGLDKLGPGLASFAPTLEAVFTKTGLVIEAFFQNISGVLQEPAFQRGVQMFFDGFLSFMRSLEPAMPALGRIVGLIGEIAGVMLQAFGPVVSEALILIAPIFEAIWEAIKPLIPVLTEMIRELLPPMAEILTLLAKEVLPPVVDLVKALAPAFTELVKTLTPYVIDFLRDFAGELKKLAEDIDPVKLMNFITEIGNAIAAVENFLKIASSPQETYAFLNSDAVRQFNEDVNNELEAFWNRVTETITNFNATVNGKLDEFWTSIKTGFQTVTTNGPAWEGFWATISAVVTQYAPGIGTVAAAAMTVTSQAIQGLSMVMPGWTTFWNSLPNPPQLAMVLVTNTVTSGMGTTAGKFIAGFAGILSTWVANWPQLLPTVVSTLSNVAGSVQGGFPNIVVSIVGGMARVLASFDQGWINVLGAVGRWFAQIVGGVARGVGQVLMESNSLPGKILAGLTNVGGFFQAGASLLGNFADGVAAGARQAVINVAQAIKDITDMLPGSPAKKGPLSGAGWTRVRGQHLVADMAAGMKDRTDLLKSVSSDIAHAASFDGASASFASARSVANGASDRALVEIQGDYYGATPERVADEFDKKVRRANLVGQLSKVGK